MIRVMGFGDSERRGALYAYASGPGFDVRQIPPTETTERRGDRVNEIAVNGLGALAAALVVWWFWLGRRR
jgi:hypothetical protein